MKVLFMVCMAVAVMARSATPGPQVVTLGEVNVSGPEDRERERGPLRTIGMTGYAIDVSREGSTRFRVSLARIR